MDRRIKINEILIYYTFALIMIAYSITYSNFLFERGITFSVIGLVLYSVILLIYRFVCNKKRKAPGYKINFIPAIINMILVIIIALVQFFLIIILYSVKIKAPSDVHTSFNEYMQNGLVFVVSLVYYLYIIRKFSNDKENYFRIPFIFSVLINTSVTIVTLIIIDFNIAFPIPVILIIYILVFGLLLVFMINHLIVLLNLSVDKKFYPLNERLKKFLFNLFKRNVGYYIGVVFVFLVGVYYVLGNGDDTYFMYIGIFFIFTSLLRVLDTVWLNLVSKKSTKVRNMNQYLLIIVNALLVLSSILLVWNVLNKAKQIENSTLDFFSFIVGVVLVIRIIFAVLGFYYSRINVKREPYHIALNSLSIIGVLISLYAFFIHFMLAVGVGRFDLISVLNVFSIVIVVLIGIVIVGMIFRGIVGLIITHKRYS